MKEASLFFKVTFSDDTYRIYFDYPTDLSMTEARKVAEEALPFYTCCQFRYKEIGKPEILLDMYMPPELKLQQLWLDPITGQGQWQDLPRVPYTSSDTYP